MERRTTGYIASAKCMSPDRSAYSLTIITNRGVPSAVLYAVSVAVTRLGILPQSVERESRCWNEAKSASIRRASVNLPVTSAAPGSAMNVSRPQ